MSLCIRLHRGEYDYYRIHRDIILLTHLQFLNGSEAIAKLYRNVKNLVYDEGER